MPASRTALLLVNRHSRRGEAALDGVVHTLESLDYRIVERGTEDPSRVSAIIREHAGRVDRVIVGGGDGTLGSAVAGLVDTGLPLGVLPMGTANNLARGLGIPTDIVAACGVAAAGEPRSVDVGVVNGHYFLTTASLGLSVAITERLDVALKRRWGILAYGAAAMRVLARVRPFHAAIRWEGRETVTRTVQIVVGNGRHYGQALTVAEDARIDDERLDLYSIELHRWWRLVGLLPALKRGRHGRRDEVLALRAREFEIHTRRPHRIDLDGELRTETPAVFRVLPGAIRIFCPVSKEAPALSSPT
jgi:YegS/Rv2252/BmrU family lipid kinase